MSGIHKYMESHDVATKHGTQNFFAIWEEFVDLSCWEGGMDKEADVCIFVLANDLERTH